MTAPRPRELVEPFRDPEHVAALLRRLDGLRRGQRKTVRVMEVCGGQTHSILRNGLDQLLPEGLELVHGPGCPVCVTPAEAIERAAALASLPGVTLASFGDMMRVPGPRGSLLDARAEGADVRVVYSPLDALALARAEPERHVVFLAVGFETTVPATASAVLQAEALGVENFSLLVAHVRVPPAMASILEAPDAGIDAFLAAGHVCTVMGTREYDALVERYRVPVVVTGFEPVDILHGLVLALEQLAAGRAALEIQYARAVRRDGNPDARAAVERVFEPVERVWRGLGELPASGLGLRAAYRRFDADARFPPAAHSGAKTSECMAGEVLRGACRPTDCPAFGGRCTPEHPLGAPMVSSEGACAAYYRYAHRRAPAETGR